MKLRTFVCGTAIAVAVLSCSENRASFFIQGMVVPTDDCVFPNDREGSFWSSGTWDIGLAGGYVLAPLLVNEMASSKSVNPNAAEASYIHVEGALVTPMTADEIPVSEERFIPASTTVFPEGNASVINFEAIDTSIYINAYPGMLDYTVDQLCSAPIVQQLILRVRVLGMTSGNKEVETPYFDFPINVCCGCLVFFSGSCRLEEGEEPTMEELCLLGQNKPVLCALCAGGDPDMCLPESTDPPFSNPWHE